jgi:CRISPR/Cas system-associated endonuclease Cas1
MLRATTIRQSGQCAVNALLSLGYSLLAKDLTIACYVLLIEPTSCVWINSPRTRFSAIV